MEPRIHDLQKLFSARNVGKIVEDAPFFDPRTVVELGPLLLVLVHDLVRHLVAVTPVRWQIARGIMAVERLAHSCFELLNDALIELAHGPTRRIC